MLYLFLLFTITPLVELWLLFRLAGVFGFWTTVFVVLATGFAGAALARLQGFWVLHQIRSDLAQGVMPTQRLGDGALILSAGLLLVTPGVLTDVLGLALLVPPLRSLIRRGLTRWLAHHVKIRADGLWQEVSVEKRADDNIADNNIIDAKVVHSRVVEE